MKETQAKDYLGDDWWGKNRIELEHIKFHFLVFGEYFKEIELA